MTTAFEDGAGQEYGGDFYNFPDRGVTAFFRDDPTLNPTPLASSDTFPGGPATYRLELGGFDAVKSSSPLWVVTRGGAAGDTFRIPAPGAYSFSFTAAIGCTGEPGAGEPVAFQVYIQAIPGPGQTAQPEISIWTDTLTLGEQYTPTGYADVVIPGGYTWAAYINVASSALGVIQIIDRTRKFSLRRTAQDTPQ